MKFAQIEKYLLILVLIVNLVILFRVLNNKEGFATVEEDQEDSDRYSGYVLDKGQFVTYQAPKPYEAVCN
jgi:hypothetical protein